MTDSLFKQPKNGCLKCGQPFGPYHELRCTRCGLRYHCQREEGTGIEAFYSLGKKELFICVPLGTLAVFNWEPI